jgi:hypothetical protein
VITSRILRAKTSTFVIYLPFSRRFFVKSKKGGMIGFMMRAIAWLAVFLDDVAVGVMKMDCSITLLQISQFIRS